MLKTFRNYRVNSDHHYLNFTLTGITIQGEVSVNRYTLITISHIKLIRTVSLSLRSVQHTGRCVNISNWYLKFHPFLPHSSIHLTSCSFSSILVIPDSESTETLNNFSPRISLTHLSVLYYQSLTVRTLTNPFNLFPISNIHSVLDPTIIPSLIVSIHPFPQSITLYVSDYLQYRPHSPHWTLDWKTSLTILSLFTVLF